MNHQRPVNLSLITMRFPVTAIVSILHRISGVLIFIMLPFVLYALQQALASPLDFARLQACWHTSSFLPFLVWLALLTVTYHVLAGIRHLLMDFGIAEGYHSGRISAWLLIVTAIIAGIVLGWCVWL